MPGLNADEKQRDAVPPERLRNDDPLITEDGEVIAGPAHFTRHVIFEEPPVG